MHCVAFADVHNRVFHAETDFIWYIYFITEWFYGVVLSISSETKSFLIMEEFDNDKEKYPILRGPA